MEFASVEIVGRVDARPHLEQTIEGRRFTWINILDSENMKTSNPVHCIAYDETAIMISSMATRGDIIKVNGVIDTVSYKGDTGNEKSFENAVVVKRAEFLSEE